MKNKKKLFRLLLCATMVVLMLTIGVSATSTGGDMSSAISNVGTALTGVIGYMSQVTSAILGDNLWLIGMGFFVLVFIAGFVMYLFRAGRR